MGGPSCSPCADHRWPRYSNSPLRRPRGTASPERAWFRRTGQARGRPRHPEQGARPPASAGVQLPRVLPPEPVRTAHARTEPAGLGSQGGTSSTRRTRRDGLRAVLPGAPSAQGLPASPEGLSRDLVPPEAAGPGKPGRASGAGRKPFSRRSRWWRQTSRAVRRVLSPGRLAAAGETAIHLGPALLPASCGLPANSGGPPSDVRAGPLAAVPLDLAPGGVYLAA